MKKEKYKETLPLLETFYYEVTKTTPTSCFDILQHAKYSLQNWKTILLVKNHRCASIRAIYCTNLLQDLICTDRTGDWEKHLRTVEKLLPMLQQCDTINHLGYPSFYLGKMRQLPDEFP